MMTVTLRELTDLLRGRFVRCRAGRPFLALAKEVGMHHSILARFAGGGMIKESQLYLIEAWCDRQEGKGHDE